MRIFISYSSRYRDICERLELALQANDRHQVFVDRSELKAGQAFDETLRAGIEDCDLLLFLVSPESVAPGSYALAELDIAKRQWRHPAGHVLPVKVAPTPKESIPAYLRAVTILEPQGDVVAETLAAVEAIRPASRRRRLLTGLAAAVVLAVALGVAGYQRWQGQRAEDAQAGTLAAAAKQLCDSGNHALAWQRYDEAVARFPQRQSVRAAREDCGMRWLREIHVVSGKETFTDIVDRVLPVLAEGATAAGAAASAPGALPAARQRAADLLAHMGWADYLRIREGAIQLDPAAHYARALAAEPTNVFAHAMWGHHVMVQSGPIDEARRHFAAAVASERERPFVRRLQFAALLYHHEPAGQIEAARVADDMRKHGEPVDADTRDRLWTYVYYDALLSRDQRAGFVSALADPDNVLTFVWLFPANEVREDRRPMWRYLLASLEEAAGAKGSARARFTALRDELKCQRNPGRLCDETLAALKR